MTGASPTTPVGELLVRWRHAAGLSQAELARRAGVSERALRELERGGTSRPRVSSLRALAEALGLDGLQRQRLLAAGRPEAAPAGPPPVTRLAPLFGRDPELGTLLEVVLRGPQRLITVTGPGGVGKSRLATQVAAVVERRTDVAVQSLDVGGLDDAATLVEVVADAVGARGRSRLDPVARVAATLGDRRLVLLLDGFERVRAAAPALRELVARCPGLTLLVTSRVPLLVGDERELPLGPLAVPGATTGADPAAVAAAPAMALLLHVGTAVRPGLALTPDTLGPLVAVCRAVDGLPLALELAAARLRLLSPAELADRLDRPLAVLGDGPSTLPERHRSLRATIESSLELVGPEAIELLARLAPFPAGVALPDLEAVVEASGLGRAWLLRGLDDLATAGLLRVTGGDGGSRYRLPDAVHELAVELLDARDDAAAIRSVTARHQLCRLAEAGGRAGGAGLPELRRDEENVRAGLLWACAHDPGPADRAVVDAFYRLCELTGRFHQGRAVLAELAAAGGPGAPWAALRAAALSSYLGETAAAQRLATRAERSFGETGDVRGRAAVQLLLGSLAAERDDLDAALEHTTAAARASETAGDLAGLGRAHNNLANTWAYRGRPDLAVRHLHLALAAKRRAGESDVDLGRTLMNLAELELLLGDTAAARTHGATAADLLGRAGHPRLQALSLTTVGLAQLTDPVRPDLEAAGAAVGRAAAQLREFGDDRMVQGVIRARAGLVHFAGEPTAAAAAAVADGLAAMLDGHGRRDVPHAVEILASLVTGTRPEAAARLLGLAAWLRATAGHPEPVSAAGEQARRRLAGRRTAEAGDAIPAEADPVTVLRTLVADAAADPAGPVPRRPAHRTTRPGPTRRAAGRTGSGH